MALITGAGLCHRQPPRLECRSCHGLLCNPHPTGSPLTFEAFIRLQISLQNLKCRDKCHQTANAALSASARKLFLPYMFHAILQSCTVSNILAMKNHTRHLFSFHIIKSFNVSFQLQEPDSSIQATLEQGSWIGEEKTKSKTFSRKVRKHVLSYKKRAIHL